MEREESTYEIRIRRQGSQADETNCSNKCASSCVQGTTDQERSQWNGPVILRGNSSRDRFLTHALK